MTYMWVFLVTDTDLEILEVNENFDVVFHTNFRKMLQRFKFQFWPFRKQELEADIFCVITACHKMILIKT